MNIGINGFGRMGRLGFRAGFDHQEYSITQINELGGTAETAAHLLEFDTVHGRWARDISFDNNSITVDGQQIAVTHNRNIADTDWSGCDIVIEASGQFRTPELLQAYFDQGVKKVVVAAPVKDPAALNVVMGCNDHLYDPEKYDIVTAASCTTNCIAPAIKVVHEKIGIVRGTITTLHDLTNTQVIVDAPHKDLRRARSAVNSLIPTTTGSATAITLIYPELKGKLNGHAVRVPMLNASLTDCVFELSREVTEEEVNALLNEAAEGELKGILGYEEKPLVSADYTNDTRSGIIDAPSTMVVDGTMLKLFVWYDNEVGYANRMMELTQKVAKSIS
ncbi:glyceraldehyde-3-phosphate dehydrogenase (NAD+) [Rubritalea squalenifaciens DSM 18772]|uniref:Glyceraldehyde-3-phosphate dehydrogenase n=1 Tax=Rubritalea squalenifaciens DSM 18772 TaxID=1123071 RepID=A0A1M6M2T6_9BACT|nr:ArsJ-associated glyceraldehyde-3-phosphate dehydrogenase [Rubritalea squalenifaciens]SHJ77772.1 glyceraldehyde-3-phosphate dehydrogenase (NAD+) [Rubritalea squalenifaciens DSM 18772]